MLRTLLVFVFCIFLFMGYCFAFELDVDSIINNLPRAYTGTYQWENSNDPWDVSVSFSSVKKLNNGNIEINGREYFINKKDKNKTYESNIRAIIDPKTLSFEMEEIYPEKKDGFIPMVYRGNISSDLKNINADWISPKGKRVSIALKANTI